MRLLGKEFLALLGSYHVSWLESPQKRLQCRYTTWLFHPGIFRAILPTSFGGNGPHLRRWLVAQPLHQTVCLLRFSGVFLGCKANARKSVHSPRIISLSTLSLEIDVTDATLGASGLWLGTRTGAGSTATRTESFFWPQPMAPWTAGKRYSYAIS